MKIKSDVEMTINFLKAVRLPENKDQTVFEICFRHKLNYDMVCRNLIKLQKVGIIERNNGRGPNTRYTFPENIKLGDVVLTLQEVFLGTQSVQNAVITVMNEFRI